MHLQQTRFMMVNLTSMLIIHSHSLKQQSKQVNSHFIRLVLMCVFLLTSIPLSLQLQTRVMCSRTIRPSEFVTKYLGVVPNDASGRTSLWADIVKHHENMQSIRAIENFTDEDVTVDQGETKKSVVVTDNITVVNTMEKLYMTVYVA